IGRADHHREADAQRDLVGLVDGTRRAVNRLAQPEAPEKTLEAAAILGEVDRVGRGPEDRYPRPLQRRRKLQRGLPAELHDHAEQDPAALFDADDLDHILGGQRLEVEPVGSVVVRRHGFRVAVDHDRLDASLAQAVGGMDAAIIEFDTLSDAVRAAAENDYLSPLARISLAFRQIEPVPLIRGIQVWSKRGELGRASVDALIDRPQIVIPTARRYGFLVEPCELA